MTEHRETKSVKPGKGVRQGCHVSLFLFNLYNEYLTKEALEGFGDFKIGGPVIHTVKYADDLVLKAKKEMVLKGTLIKLNEDAMEWK
jgi:predicted nucleotidyltransferase